MKIVCVGAGASGLFYSLTAASLGHEVILLESSEKVGRKLLITGKGRCNITNDCSAAEVIDKTVTNPKFLFSCLNAFPPSKTIEWFNNHGCELKTERGNRVFPVSDKSADIVNALLRECQKAGVRIVYKEKVNAIRKADYGFRVIGKMRDYSADAVVIATGGKSYPLTGSTGDGYRFAESFGHTIIPPSPALCPIKIKESIPRTLLSLTLRNVALTAKNGNFKKTLFGDMEFLENAITGPISLSMSSLINKIGYVELHLDFKPALDEEKLRGRLLRDIANNPSGDVLFLLKGLLPMDIIDFFVRKLGIDTTIKLGCLKKAEREAILAGLKRFPLTFDGLESLEKGIITSGGVSPKEIDSKTMESKLVKGLHFVGEVIDVDAFTGGYNLQIALATAYAAATHMGS